MTSKLAMKININCCSSVLLVILAMLMCFTSCHQNGKMRNPRSLSGRAATTALDNQRLHLAGRYENISVAIDSSGLLTGVYEYYNAWDSHFKEYMQINVFYFTGMLQGNRAKIETAWPTSDQRIDGVIEFGEDTLKLILKEMPDGYASDAFTEGVVKRLTSSHDWSQIGIVKSPKVYLLNEPDSFRSRNAGYLVKYDIVKIISKSNDNWVRVEFSKKNVWTQSVVGWIMLRSIYSYDAAKWIDN